MVRHIYGEMEREREEKCMGRNLIVLFLQLFSKLKITAEQKVKKCVRKKYCKKTRIFFRVVNAG